MRIDILFNFDGTINRSTFWTYYLALWGAAAVVFVFVLLMTTVFEPAAFLVYPAGALGIWSVLALLAKRIRDAGYSPYLLLAFPLPFVGVVLFLMAGIAPTTGAGRSRCMRCNKQIPSGSALCADCLGIA